MSTRKADRRFKRRYILRSVILFVPPLVAFVVLWLDRGRFELPFWLATAFFLAWLVFWIIGDAALLRSYDCPSCGRRIGSPTIPNRGAGDPIRYHCPECDIEWDTGLRESSD